MKTYREFLAEAQFKQDNPGGSWLRHKQENADTDYHRRKGLNGATTGYFNKNLHLPVSHLNHLPGAMGEHEFRDHGPKQDQLSKQIGHPSKFDSKNHPIMIGVNHRGEAHVMEGNHRLAYAKRHGISHIHAEVKYYNGGETHPGPHSPQSLLKLHKSDS
jgi:hypothetical protein